MFFIKTGEMVLPRPRLPRKASSAASPRPLHSRGRSRPPPPLFAEAEASVEASDLASASAIRRGPTSGCGSRSCGGRSRLSWSSADVAAGAWETNVIIFWTTLKEIKQYVVIIPELPRSPCMCRLSHLERGSHVVCGAPPAYPPAEVTLGRGADEVVVPPWLKLQPSWGWSETAKGDGHIQELVRLVAHRHHLWVMGEDAALVILLLGDTVDDVLLHLVLPSSPRVDWADYVCLVILPW